MDQQIKEKELSISNTEEKKVRVMIKSLDHLLKLMESS